MRASAPGISPKRAGATADARAALPGEPDPLTVAHPARDVDLDAAPVAQRQPALAPARGFLQPQVEHGLVVRPAHRELLNPRPAPTRAPSAAEHSLEQVAEIAPAELDSHVLEAVASADCLVESARAGGVLARPPSRAELVVELSAELGVSGRDARYLPYRGEKQIRLPLVHRKVQQQV